MAKRPDPDITTRTLMAMKTEIEDAREALGRVEVLYAVLAKQHGIDLPKKKGRAIS